MVQYTNKIDTVKAQTQRYFRFSVLLYNCIFQYAERIKHTYQSDEHSEYVNNWD